MRKFFLPLCGSLMLSACLPKEPPKYAENSGAIGAMLFSDNQAYAEFKEECLDEYADLDSSEKLPVRERVDAGVLDRLARYIRANCNETSTYQNTPLFYHTHFVKGVTKSSLLSDLDAALGCASYGQPLFNVCPQTVRQYPF